MPSEKQPTLPSQEFIDLKTIENDTVILKSGALRKILLVSGINFALKSEEEQEMITNAFQGFLNSLDFSIQIFIHSRKLNIDGYLEKLENRETQEENELLKNQIHEYREFIKTLVIQNTIMQKQFFAVVPYESAQITQVGADIVDKILGLFKKKDKTAEQKEEKSLSEQLDQINQRVDHIINGLHQINLRAVPLNNEELKELFYNLYNPASIEKKKIK